MDREAPSMSHYAGRLSGLRFTKAGIDLIYMRICPIKGVCRMCPYWPDLSKSGGFHWEVGVI